MFRSSEPQAIFNEITCQGIKKWKDTILQSRYDLKARRLKKVTEIIIDSEKKV